MSLFDIEEKAPVLRCDICGAQSLYGVWGHDLCVECTVAWNGEDQFTSGAVDKALGLTPPSKPGDHERVCAEFERRTKAWVRARRNAVATESKS